MYDISISISTAERSHIGIKLKYFWLWFLVFENFKFAFWIRILTLGGLFYKTFWFEAFLYILSSKTTVCRLLLRNCCTLLALPISSEILDGFWCSRCLNDRVHLLYMIGSFASGANVSLVAKNGTKRIIPLLWIKSSKKPQIKK